VAADDVAALEREQAGSHELATGHGFGNRLPGRAGIEQQRDNCRRVAEVQC